METSQEVGMIQAKHSVSGMARACKEGTRRAHRRRYAGQLYWPNDKTAGRAHVLLCRLGPLAHAEWLLYDGVRYQHVHHPQEGSAHPGCHSMPAACSSGRAAAGGNGWVDGARPSQAATLLLSRCPTNFPALHVTSCWRCALHELAWLGILVHKTSSSYMSPGLPPCTAAM